MGPLNEKTDFFFEKKNIAILTKNSVWEKKE